MTAEKILEEIALESGFDTWEMYVECFSTTEHGRRVINKGVLKAVNQALILHNVVLRSELLACKCDIPDPFRMMPNKCFRCKGKIELS